ncbi:grasp-with-spasm system SPASM domain peptide maturase [Chryseobacterium sp. 2987]|uniref:grasp-with-spasm system SPASM domain peptide maturase n=1 Tax=Chryseobacterium sp. 2987 TaxID=2817767 RepID=UPI00285886FD|nr:grasp-with-spasm system SPASM domain peptide maturase [Chryseobacterium sp. 2987]MDR6923543.1 SPASM domain peptide maturase of grasp-with-spasm system [Chryseobacterium sp. 2987]
MESEWLKLYSNCVLVQGASRASICDLQRGEIHLIPLSLAELFNKKDCFNINNVRKKLNPESQKVLDDYIEFLVEHELCFFCTSKEINRFPKMPEEWLFPAHISHAVLDTYSNFDYFDDSFLAQLEKLCCNHLQFRFFNEISTQELKLLLEKIKPTQMKSIEVILPENKEEIQFYDTIVSLVNTHKKISTLIITNADDNKVLQDEIEGMGMIVKVTEKIDSPLHCGLMSPQLFNVNIPTYTESINHNSCLNRKLSIDTDGNIKNCPAMKASFGNIRNTALEEAVSHSEFKRYWNITKDQITKCKDCEFRHVCIDCRAYIENPEDQYSAPLKCGYDPQICEWEDWSIHPLKQRAINRYGMREIIK